MNAERLKLIQSVFAEAIEIGDDQVDSFLEHRCSDDLDLRQRVRALMSRDQKLHASSFMQRRTSTVNDRSEEERLDGRRIGAYKIVRWIGGGGMGDVHLACREDDFQQQVAIKVIRQSAHSPSLAKRFRTEMQCLASLGEHPNITTILDAGETDDGQLYLIMEYIDGVRVNEYCDQQSLGIRERLELFCKICDAVQFAHQNLILHRDLKPGNLLITPGGQPKLIDFGVSKLFANEVEFSTHQTLTTHPTFTPGYSSPEQLNGQPTATTSDVYSLGVILYELLTGHLPHRVAGESLADLLNTVSNVEPVRPSEVVKQNPAQQNEDGSVAHADSQTIARHRAITLKKLQSTIRGDLDRIVLKAIEKEPSRRYQTAQQFGEDIQRYLNGQPVLARGDSIGYRLRKGVQRNKAAVATVASILLLLTCGIAVSARFAVLARRSAEQATEAADSERQQRLLAEKREKTANQIADLFESMVERADPKRAGKDYLVRDLLDDLTTRVRSEEIDEPLVRARLLQSLASSYLGLGEFDLADQNLNDAIGILTNELGESHLETAEAWLQLANSKILSMSPKPAKLILQRLLSDLDSRPSVDPQRRKIQFNATLLLATALIEKSELDSATSVIENAFQMAKDPSERLNVSQIQHRLQIKQRKFEEALPFAKSELARVREEYGSDDYRIIKACQHLGAILNYLQRYEEAEVPMKEGLEVTRRVFGNDHPETLRSVMNVAVGNFNQRDFEDAERFFAEYQDIAERLNHYAGVHHHQMLICWAQSSRKIGKLDQAKQIVDKCEAFFSRNPAENRKDLAKLRVERQQLEQVGSH